MEFINENSESFNHQVEEKNHLKGKTLHIQVLSEEKDKVNIKIPLSLSKFFLKKDSKITQNIQNKHQIDLEEVLNIIETQEIGDLIDVESSNGDIVKIFIR